MNFWKTFAAALLAIVVGGIMTFVLGLLVLVGIIASLGSQDAVTVRPHSALVIDLGEDITDTPVRTPMEAIDFANLRARTRLPLLHALRAIEAAATDPSIEGIYIRPAGEGEVSLAALEELRAAVAAFKESGKFVLAYNEYYSQPGYFLSSVADEVYLQPQGRMEWQGMALTTMFFKGLFDKLDLHAEVFRPTACRYKSAVEPYIREDMSAENREQLDAVLKASWGEITERVAASRGIAPERLDSLASTLAVTLPEDAVQARLVDSLRYEDEVQERLLQKGVKREHLISLHDYATQVRPKTTGQRIAVLYAEGAIVDGQGMGEDIYGNTLAASIAELRRDSLVKAVVLRINSPGGSALASEVIWREMELLRAKKPVIVSMGQYAASGGYYIACGADAILADRTTLTGSIGVFGLFVRAEEALRGKLGVTFDTAKTNPSADMGRMRALTASERATIMRAVDATYDTFVSRVAAGRNLSKEQVLELAGGRVWSGADAARNGLVDGIGGLTEAIALAADRAALGTDYRVVEHLESPSGLTAFLSGFSAKVKADFTADELGVFAGQWRRLNQAMRQRGVVAYSPYFLE